MAACLAIFTGSLPTEWRHFHSDHITGTENKTWYIEYSNVVSIDYIYHYMLYYLFYLFFLQRQAKKNFLYMYEMYYYTYIKNYILFVFSACEKHEAM